MIQPQLAIALLALGLLLQRPALSGVFEAICETDTPCTVSHAEARIATSDVTIDQADVLSWSLAGAWTRPDRGMQAAAQVLSSVPSLLRVPGIPGLSGLMGSGAQTHDYRFQNRHLDDDGVATTSTIRFVNREPANRFMMELIAVTGLTMGQINERVQSRMVKAPELFVVPKRAAAADCRPVLQPFACRWSGYLEVNDDVRLWSETHPHLVPAQKARLGAVD